MNFLGIGPGEIFLILILLLVVVGPERLPEFARGAGRLVVRVRDWVARSPDAQMVMRARDELQVELQELRKSLTEEVETVRKELESVRGDLAEATKMVEESAEEVASTRLELDAYIDATEPALNGATPEAASETIAPPRMLNPPAEPSFDALQLAEPAGDGALGTPDVAAPLEGVAPINGQAVPRTHKPGREPAPGLKPAAAPPPEVEAFDRRIEKLSAEFEQQLQALTAEFQALRARLVASADAAPEPVAQPAALSTELEVALASDAPDSTEPLRRRCKGTKRSGEPCGAPPLKGQEYCRVHARQRVLEEVA